MSRKADPANDVVSGRLKTAQPEPIQFELDDESLPGRAIVWNRCCKSSFVKELDARANVFAFYGIEIPHDHRALSGGPAR
jgi:hypothetical protein